MSVTPHVLCKEVPDPTSGSQTWGLLVQNRWQWELMGGGVFCLPHPSIPPLPSLPIPGGLSNQLYPRARGYGEMWGGCCCFSISLRPGWLQGGPWEGRNAEQGGLPLKPKTSTQGPRVSVSGPAAAAGRRPLGFGVGRGCCGVWCLWGCQGWGGKGVWFACEAPPPFSEGAGNPLPSPISAAGVESCEGNGGEKGNKSRVMWGWGARGSGAVPQAWVCAPKTGPEALGAQCRATLRVTGGDGTGTAVALQDKAKAFGGERRAWRGGWSWMRSLVSVEAHLRRAIPRAMCALACTMSP